MLTMSDLQKNFTGQGKCASTILTEGGWHYPVIADQSYRERLRAQTAAFKTGRGARPMHSTTLLMSKPPWEPSSGFKTTTKQYFSGSRILSPIQRPGRCASMHNFHFEIGNRQERNDWRTHYDGNFVKRDLVPANRSHMTSLVHRIDQTDGSNMKTAMHVDKTNPTYWSQYSRIHSKLGYLLTGPGQPYTSPPHKHYNVLTGEFVEQAARDENSNRKRVSGNRVLFQEREKSRNKFILN